METKNTTKEKRLVYKLMDKGNGNWHISSQIMPNGQKLGELEFSSLSKAKKYCLDDLKKRHQAIRWIRDRIYKWNSKSILEEVQGA